MCAQRLCLIEATIEESVTTMKICPQASAARHRVLQGDFAAPAVCRRVRLPHHGFPVSLTWVLGTGWFVDGATHAPEPGVPLRIQFGLRFA